MPQSKIFLGAWQSNVHDTHNQCHEKQQAIHICRLAVAIDDIQDLQGGCSNNVSRKPESRKFDQLEDGKYYAKNRSQGLQINSTSNTLVQPERSFMETVKFYRMRRLVAALILLWSSCWRATAEHLSPFKWSCSWSREFYRRKFNGCPRCLRSGAQLFKSWEEELSSF